MLLIGSLHQSALHGVVKDVDKGLAAHRVGLLHQGLHESRLAAVKLDENFFSGFQLYGPCDEKAGQLSNPWIFHSIFLSDFF